MISTEVLFRLVRGPVVVAEPLATYTAIRTGGPADFMVNPRDRADLVRACDYFSRQGVPLFILGKGSSLLVNDQGFRGAVIATRLLDRIAIEDEIAEVDAGVLLPVLLERLRQASLTGLDAFDTMSGSVGGALRRNAEGGSAEVIDSVEWIDIVRKGRLRRLKRRELSVGSTLPLAGEEVILGAGFRLRRISSKEKRECRQETGGNAVPSPAEGISVKVFRTPPTLSTDEDASPGELVEACGLRGKRIGGASLSLTDANTIVNAGGASSNDVFELVRLLRVSVQEKFGVKLNLELTLVGFNRNGCDDPFRT
jgi:UDP-N-acetylmuramate dehydrogenase